MINRLPLITSIAHILVVILILSMLISACGPTVGMQTFENPTVDKPLIQANLVAEGGHMQVYKFLDGLTLCYFIVNPHYDNIAPDISCLR